MPQINKQINKIKLYGNQHGTFVSMPTAVWHLLYTAFNTKNPKVAFRRFLRFTIRTMKAAYKNDC